jgi:hypothetical protein
LTGGNFQAGARVFVGAAAAPWPKAKRKSDTSIVLNKGAALEAVFPRDVDVEIRVVNPDGGSARTTFRRR